MECLPRPEHPQPQFQRADWLNLNGIWDFQFDDQDLGLAQNWQNGLSEFSRPILVPFAFESPASGIGETGFHPRVWYSRTFSVPDSWAGRRLMLHFGAVDYRAMVWVNGKYAGDHEGGHTPFSFDITRMLKKGENTVSLRVEDPPKDRSIPRGKQFWEEKPASIYYTRTTGIWQTVWLEPVGQSYMELTRIHPQIDGSVVFDTKIAHPASGTRLTATVSYQDQVVARGTAECDGTEITVAVFVREPHLWSPEFPALYDVRLELSSAEGVDTVDSYFGFRSVDTQDGKLLLNGYPLYLKTVLDQGYWPESNLTPPSDEAIRLDIQRAKEFGFNGVRKHQKIEDPRFYYWADKMGLLVSGESANAYRYDDLYVSRMIGEWTESVERDYNHPSIIMWIPLNESWGVPDLADSRQQFHLRTLYSLTKSLDATRLVIDNDGWEHTEMTDLLGLHDYAANGTLLQERYKDAGKPGARVPDNARSALAPGVQYNGSPLFLSEFGGIAWIPPGTKVPQESWGYAGVEKSQDAAIARLRGLYEGIAKSSGFIGICYTQLTDVEQEVNSLLTYDRKPKFDTRAIREINALLQ